MMTRQRYYQRHGTATTARSFMSDFPYIPLSTDALIADCIHLSSSEFGLYIRILVLIWQSPECTIPNDDKILAQYARCSPVRWKAMKPQVLQLWNTGDENPLISPYTLNNMNHRGSVPFSSIPTGLAASLVKNQKKYSAAQIEFVKNYRHLVWVNPPSRAIKKSLRHATWEQSDGKCTYCECVLTKESFTVDHVLARCNGGTDDIENLVVACRSCNSSKGAKFL